MNSRKKIAGVIVVAAVVCCSGIMVASSGGAQSVGVICGGYEGIYFRPAGQVAVEVFPCLTKGRAIIYGPPIAFCPGKLVYYSDIDKALRIVPLSGSSRWIGIGDWLAAGGDVVSITPSPTGVMINTAGTSPTGDWKRTGAYSLDIASGGVVKVGGAVEAYTTVDSDEIAARNEMGGIDLHRGDEVKPIRSAKIAFVDRWAFDGANHVLCITDGSQIRLVDTERDTKKIWNVPFYLGVTSITIQGAIKEVWVGADLPFSQGTRLIRYDFTGRNRGTTLYSRFPIGFQVLATAEKIQLLKETGLSNGKYQLSD